MRDAAVAERLRQLLGDAGRAWRELRAATLTPAAGAVRDARQRTWDRLPAVLRPLIWFGLSLLILAWKGGDDTWMRMFFLVALYVTLGMGLNVVVGMAGLLDLGYVAFFAAGAYVVGVLGSPVSPKLDAELNYWFLLPLAIGFGALLGVLLGLPVLPLRGDYLAIVTLGFGEIIRICAVNMDDWTNGSQGLFAIPEPDLGLRKVNDVDSFYVMIVAAAFLVWFLTSRLRDSRVGRAWEAIREDEDVAAGMGIDTTRYKLMAFAVGASVAALGGAIFAPFLTAITPSSFTLLVSINVVALVVIGGMGSTQGVVAGAVILIGVPELLTFQESKDFLQHFGWLRAALNAPIDAFNWATHLGVESLPPSSQWGNRVSDYRFIIFGGLLVLVMVLRPSGLFPSRRRQLEFEQPPEAEVAGRQDGAP